MLQVNNGVSKPFRIKSIRRLDDTERSPVGGVCSPGEGNASDKPPC